MVKFFNFQERASMAPETVNGLVISRRLSLDFKCRYETSIDDISAERTIVGGSISSGLIGRDTWPGFKL